MKDQTVIIQFGPDGNGRCLYTDAIDLTALGKLEVRRASTIEYNASQQLWQVRLESEPNKIAFWNRSREFCLRWEIAYFSKQLQKIDGKL